MNPMDPEIKARWVAALRSGEYPQGRHGLRGKDESRFCCLGVLCDLHAKEGLGEWNRGGYKGIDLRYEDEVCYLPISVLKWSGLEERAPRIGEVTLSGLNDEGKSFPEIANLIEAHL